jgi:PAS domain S-box-containing protein
MNNTNREQIQCAPDVSITDLFSVEELQRIQDSFADATGVASLITHPDGTPITTPSNFCRLCRDIIRRTEQGRANCIRSDSVIGKQNSAGPTIQACLSGGLWDAGASITVMGRHIANWLVGQVKDATCDEETLIGYAKRIGADIAQYRAALREVPVMSPDQFQKIAKLVFLLSNELSRKAFQNLRQKQVIAERKRAEEALKESQQWLRVTLASIGDAVMTTDTEGRVTYLNPVAADLTGWPPAEAEGKSVPEVFRIVNERTRVPCEDIVSRVLRDRRVAELANHTALISKDGREIPIEDSAAPIVDSSGKIFGVVLVFHDVTEKRRAQQALTESEQRYRGLVEMSPDPIIVHRNDRIEFVNPAAMKLMGAETPEQILGKSLYDIYHPGYHALIRERIGQLRQGHTAPLIEEKLLRFDGETVDVAVTGSSFVDQHGPAIQVVLHDITERKQKEEHRQKLHRTLVALNNSNQALLHAEDEASLLQQICRIIIEDCGYAMVWIGFAEDDENKSVTPVAYAGVHTEYLQALRISWADNELGQGPTGTAIRTAQPSLCRDMSMDPAFEPWRARATMSGFAASLVLPLVKDGKAFGAMTIYSRTPDPFSEDEIKLLGKLGSDLAYGVGSLRLQAAHALAQQALIRSEKLASVGRMAASIAHEINNPLAAVMNTLFLARTTLAEPDLALQYLDIADDELKRISHITRQTLGFYRESSAPAPVSITSIMDSAVDLLRGKVRLSRAIIEKQYEGDFQAQAVSGELRQVFSNLLANSLEAIAPGGTVKLRISKLTRIGTGQRRIRITVADNGKGIDSMTMPRIFEPLFTTKESTGSGLGLWISKQLVEKHGGSIRVRSTTKQPRHGTVISVMLPSPEQAEQIRAVAVGG